LTTRRSPRCFTADENRPVFIFLIHPFSRSAPAASTQTGFSSVPLLFSIFFILITFSFSSPLQAAASPEFHQLLGEVNAQLKTFVPTRGPRCTPDLIDKVQNALQGEIFTGALNAVVVKPLETGAKAGLSMLGIPAAAITTYSLMRCAMDEGDAAGFGKCALGEAIGYGAGAGLDRAGVDAVSGALSGVALDDAYGRVRGAYEAYQSTSETVSGESEGDCKVRYSIRWSKRKSPGARGGKIHFQSWVSDCKCNSASEAKSGYVSTWFKVNYRKAGNNQPGWKLNTFEKLHVEAQCCGQSAAAKNNVFLFNPQGLLVRDTPPPVTPGPATGAQPTETETGDQGEGDTSTTPEPPRPPPPVILPPPEKEEYSRANPCPPCKPIQDKITEVARESGDLLKQRSGKLGEKNQKESDKGKVEQQIERLQSRLRGEAGTGGESTDAEGNTTSSYDMGDGRVRIRVTDAQGNVISERFRQRESTADIQAGLDAKKKELEQIEKDIGQLQKDIDEIDKKREELKKKYDNLQKALTDCVERLCNQYATCKQLLEHIQAYENAGLQVRSRSIIDNLKKRARQMGCYDVDKSMSQLVSDNYDLTGEQVFKPSILDDLQPYTLGAGLRVDVGCEGSSCPDEPPSGVCSGDNCPDAFLLNCVGNNCPTNIQLDCLGNNTCPAGTTLNCFPESCPESVNFVCTDNQCNYVQPIGDGPLQFSSGAGARTGTVSQQFDFDSIDFEALDSYSESQSYSDGTFQVPYTGTALNTALGLDADAAPPATLQQLQQAEQQAVQNAISANNYANTVADAFQQAGSTSIQTASSLAAATEAEGVQEFLIDFGSALADLASVSDFFEGVAKGDMSDNTLLQNLDSIYEAAKDGESLANNIADQITPLPDGTSTSPVNDAFGTMGVADDYWGTDGLTNINSLKSDYSDIANIIDDYRNGKPLNGRTLGQLIFRVGKGFAENDLKERQQQIANLQQDLAAEQRVSSGLAGQLQAANEAKWNAMDELASVRAAITALIASSPETLSVTISGDSPVIETTAKCPECQPIADRINQATNAMYAARQQIAAIEARQQALEAKKAKLQQLKDQLQSADRVLNTARAGLESTDVPVLGPAQEIQNQINLLEMDRRQLVNEIGRLEREIEIEEGDPEAEIETLQKAISDLHRQLRQLRYDLFVCEEDKCKAALGRDLTTIFGPIFGVEVIDTRNISGNDPYDPRDPIAEDSSQIGSGTTGGTTTPGATVQVVNNIPISRLTLAGPDACPANHFHGNANNCNGVFTADPAPGVCGHGTVADVINIPVSSCPDL